MSSMVRELYYFHFLERKKSDLATATPPIQEESRSGARQEMTISDPQHNGHLHNTISQCSVFPKNASCAFFKYLYFG